MEVADEYVIAPLTTFARNSKMLVNKCHQPDGAEYSRALLATTMGFLAMGIFGFAIKLVFIPVNNVIMGQ
jgi:protein transport protein SEC61 subunit gamma-like protein